MKQFIFNLLCIVFLVSLYSCQTDERAAYEGEGYLKLNARIEEQDVAVVSRAIDVDEQALLEQNCKIRIYDTEKLVYKCIGINNVQDDLLLSSGDYRVRITAGDSVAASFDKKFYEGTENFKITKGGTSSVYVTCGIVNTLTRVIFAESLNDVFKDYHLDIKVKAEDGILQFSPETQADEDRIGYYNLPQDADSLFCTFTARTISGQLFVHEDTIVDAKPATRYDLRYHYVQGSTGDTGGGMLQLKVDATPLRVVNEGGGKYYQRPILSLVANSQNQDLYTPYYLAVGAGWDMILTVSGSSALQNVVLSSEQLWNYVGLTGAEFDLLALNEEQKNTLSSKGFVLEEYPELQGYKLSVTLPEAFMKSLSVQEGQYSVGMKAQDAKGKQRNIDWNILISDATVQIEKIPLVDIWTSRAILHGSIVEDRTLTGEAGFRYRVAGGEWLTTTSVQISDGRMLSAEVIDLLPGQVYDYQVMDGETYSVEIGQFTTEQAVQLPNSSFEDWVKSGKIWYLCDNLNNMFWDSGNTGSSSANINITTQNTSIKHSGSSSAELKSQMATILGFGQFAAGNIFIGKYIDTWMDGLKGNGILGWGRPFASRPIALQGYIKYRPSTVSSDWEYNGGKLEKGKPDRGIIYIALGDWSKNANYPEWPVVVRTDFNNPGKVTLFNSNSESVIAYGEQIWTDNTVGEEMIKFTIRLDYRSNRKPNSIVLVASSSQYGDYFAGAAGSTMWLDDLTLVYDEKELIE